MRLRRLLRWCYARPPRARSQLGRITARILPVASLSGAERVASRATPTFPEQIAVCPTKRRAVRRGLQPGPRPREHRRRRQRAGSIAATGCDRHYALFRNRPQTWHIGSRSLPDPQAYFDVTRALGLGPATVTAVCPASATRLEATNDFREVPGSELTATRRYCCTPNTVSSV